MPLPSLSADLDLVLADAGAPVTYGSPVQQTNGILRTVDQIATTGGDIHLADAMTTLLIRDGTLTGLLEDQPITVGGIGYVIRHTGSRLADGARRLTLVADEAS